MLASAKELEATVVLKGHTNSIECCAFHPAKSELLVTGSHDHTLKTWDVVKGTCVSTLEAHNGGVWSCQFSNDKNTLLTSSPDKKIKIWDLSSSKVIATFEGHTNAVYWAKFNPQNNLIASGGADAETIIWDVKQGTAVKKIQSTADIVYSVEWSSDGKAMYTTDSNGMLLIYETAGYEGIQEAAQKCRAYAISTDSGKDSKIPDGIFVAYEDKYSRLYKYDTVRNTIELAKEYGAHSDQVKNNVYHGKSNTLVTCCRDGSAKVWDPETGALEFNLVGHTDSVSCAAFNHSDASMIAVGAWDQTALVYKLSK